MSQPKDLEEAAGFLQEIKSSPAHLQGSSREWVSPSDCAPSALLWSGERLLVSSPTLKQPGARQEQWFEDVYIIPTCFKTLKTTHALSHLTHWPIPSPAPSPHKSQNFHSSPRGHPCSYWDICAPSEGEKAERETKVGFGPSGENCKETSPRGSSLRALPAAGCEHDWLRERLQSILVALQTQTAAETEVVGGGTGAESQLKTWGAC